MRLMLRGVIAFLALVVLSHAAQAGFGLAWRDASPEAAPRPGASLREADGAQACLATVPPSMLPKASGTGPRQP